MNRFDTERLLEVGEGCELVGRRSAYCEILHRSVS